MGLPLDEVTWKKLVLLKQLYAAANAQSAVRYSPVGRILAVIGFDLSVETGLKITVAALDSRVQPDKTFGALMQQANAKLQAANHPSLAYEASVRHVHAIRNDAQHKARFPTETDVLECRIDVRDFLRGLTDNVWGVSFDDISLADLVQNKKSKEYLRQAESAAANGEYGSALRLARTALAWTTSLASRRLWWPSCDLIETLEPYDSSEAYVDEDLAEAMAEAFLPFRDELNEKLSALEEAMLPVALGINYAGYVRLHLRLLINTTFDSEGVPCYEPATIMTDISEDDARFALQFCTDAVLQIEAQIGDLDAPATAWAIV